MTGVYITGKIPDEGIYLLRKKGYKVEINDSSKKLTQDELKAVFSKFDAIITLLTDLVDNEVIGSASPKLKIISNYSAGFDNVDVLSASRRGVVTTNTPGVAGEAVSEHTFALILACRKRILAGDKYVRLGKFTGFDSTAFVAPQLRGETIGIIGLGKIGMNVGRMAYEGFRMNILYHDILRYEDFEILTEAKFTNLEHLLKKADVVTIHCPLTSATYHLIGKEQLELMKKSAILINTSRGRIVDEKALIWALGENKIAAAGLDVFENEPFVSHELTTLGNVVLTPHVASATLETRTAMAKIAAQNIIDVFEGRTPAGLIKVG